MGKYTKKLLKKKLMKRHIYGCNMKWVVFRLKFWVTTQILDEHEIVMHQDIEEMREEEVVASVQMGQDKHQMSWFILISLCRCDLLPHVTCQNKQYSIRFLQQIVFACLKIFRMSITEERKKRCCFYYAYLKYKKTKHHINQSYKLEKCKKKNYVGA